MKRVGNIRKQFLTKERINEAIDHLCASIKQKHWTRSVKRDWKILLADRKGLVDRIYVQLLTRTYKFKPFKIFHRNESKKTRIIYASYPEDQIVDYILDLCLKYVFTEKKKFIHPNSYGSITGKGQHELRKRVLNKIKDQDEIYVAICDTHHYYPTINHEILLNILKKHIKDEWLFWLCEKTIKRMKGDVGLALGLASSNILGHVYHSDIDWTITQEYKVKDYYRFCDDKIMIGKDKNFLHTMVRELEKLVNDIGQEVKRNWKVVGCNRQRFEFLGSLMNTKNGIISSYKRRSIERKFKKEIKRPFNYRTDSDRVLMTWAGLKGSFRDLSLRNLFKWWVYKSPFEEFFRRLLIAMNYVEQRRVYKYYPELINIPENFKIGDEDAILNPKSQWLN